MRRLPLAIKLLLALVALLVLGTVAAHAAPAMPAPADPSLSIPLPGNNQDPGTNLSILGLFTLITLGPSLLIMMTGFTRILIVLGFLRNALGTPSIPPNQVLVGLSLFLTLFVMAPTFNDDQREGAAAVPGGRSGREGRSRRRRSRCASSCSSRPGRSDLALFVKLVAPRRPPRTRRTIRT